MEVEFGVPDEELVVVVVEFLEFLVEEFGNHEQILVSEDNVEMVVDLELVEVGEIGGEKHPEFGTEETTLAEVGEEVVLDEVLGGPVELFQKDLGQRALTRSSSVDVDGELELQGNDVVLQDDFLDDLVELFVVLGEEIHLAVVLFLLLGGPHNQEQDEGREEGRVAFLFLLVDVHDVVVFEDLSVHVFLVQDEELQHSLVFGAVAGLIDERDHEERGKALQHHFKVGLEDLGLIQAELLLLEFFLTLNHFVQFKVL